MWHPLELATEGPGEPTAGDLWRMTTTRGPWASRMRNYWGSTEDPWMIKTSISPWGQAARNLWAPTTRDPSGQGTEYPWRYTTTGSWEAANTGSFTTDRPDLACMPRTLMSTHPWLLPTGAPHRQPVTTENDIFMGDATRENPDFSTTEYPVWTTRYWRGKTTERELANTRNEDEYTLSGGV